jgi:hypothetical protein
MSESPQADRRLNCRYPVSLPVEYKLFARSRTTCHGFGRTLNISSRGVLFQVENALPAGKRIEIQIDWPFLFDGGRPITLVVWGTVVRRDRQLVAVRFRYHRFRSTVVMSRTPGVGKLFA